MRRRRSGTLPSACAASVCSSTSRSRVIAPIASSGCSTPISLLAAMTLTRIVPGVIASRSASRSTSPSASTPRTVTRRPSRSSRRQVSSTARCSVATVMTWSPLSRRAATAPFSARLLASVAPLVKTISFGDALDQRGNSCFEPPRPPCARDGRPRDRRSTRCRTDRGSTAASPPGPADPPASSHGRPCRSRVIFSYRVWRRGAEAQGRAWSLGPRAPCVRSVASNASTVKINGYSRSLYHSFAK